MWLAVEVWGAFQELVRSRACEQVCNVSVQISACFSECAAAGDPAGSFSSVTMWLIFNWDLWIATQSSSLMFIVRGS